MGIEAEIKEYIARQAEPKRSGMQAFDQMIRKLGSSCKLWFLNGKNSENKTLTNPNIGYGLQTIQSADGKTKAFYRMGLSANKTGLSVYVLGIDDKTYLARTYGEKIGKASVTGYCIRFKILREINIILQVSIGTAGAIAHCMRLDFSFN